MVWFGIPFGMGLVWACQNHTKAYQSLWSCLSGVYIKVYQILYQTHTKAIPRISVPLVCNICIPKKNKVRALQIVWYGLWYAFGMGLVCLWYRFGKKLQLGDATRRRIRLRLPWLHSRPVRASLLRRLLAPASIGPPAVVLPRQEEQL